MKDQYNLQRFLDAQKHDYSIALQEIKNGRKQSHWMWYIFPQLKGLGCSYNADYYGIADLSEAIAYLENKTMRERLEEISKALLEIIDNDALLIMGNPDHHKLKSSMTLFSSVPGSNPVFEKVLIKFFEGRKSRRTLKILQEGEH
ncbi:DUF1810 domain-containing protein [Gillisia sp. Q332]|uniref:DUF1810 domain-containing protein n=1 Tax=Gillisia xinjiangensis TaxID=3384765 RepID=UPI00391CDF95